MQGVERGEFVKRTEASIVAMRYFHKFPGH